MGRASSSIGGASSISVPVQSSSSPRSVPEPEQGEEPEPAKGESGDGEGFEVVDGIGGEALDGGLLHGIDTLEDGFEGLGVACGKHCPTSDRGNDGDLSRSRSFRNMDGVNRDVVALETLRDLDVLPVAQVEAGSV